MQYLLEILADQTVDVGLVAVGGGGEPTDAAIVIRAPTEEAADDGAMSFELAAGSVAPWLGLVPADGAQLERLLGERPATTGYEFAVRGSRRQIIAAQTSPFWTALARSPGGWRVTATVGEPHGRGLCGLSITGTGAEGPLLATLLAVDAAPNFRLEPRLARGVELDRLVDLQRLASAPPTLPLDLRELAWLFSFPVRAQGRWLVLARSPIAPETVLDTIDGVQPPHVWISGASGMGKTTLLEQLIQRDVDSDRRVVVVDPHGDLAERAASRLEAMRVPTVVVDFGRDDPPGWNLSVPESGVDTITWASLLEDIVRDLWPDMPEETFGPSFSRSIRLAFRLLLEDPEGPLPLTRLPELIGGGDFADEVLARAPDRTVAEQWRREAIGGIFGGEHGNHNRMWFASKIDPLIGDPTVARIITQPSSFEVSSVVTDGLSLVVNAPTRRLTPSGARLLSAILVSRVWLVVSRMRPVEAPPIALYIDEWHRVPAPALATMLAEARKFNIALRLANQNVGQLRGQLLESVTANAGAVITFRTGARDAALLAGSFPGLDADDLRTLPDHWVAVASGGHSLVAPTPAPLPRSPRNRDALERLGTLLVDWRRLEATIDRHNRSYAEERKLLLAQVAGWIQLLLFRHVPAGRAMLERRRGRLDAGADRAAEG
jgi:hypothetical protein